MDDVLMLVADAAKALRTSPSSIRRWIEAGRLECQRTTTGTRLIRASEVKRLLREHIKQVGKTK